ncbi:hypothetical protein [Mucilaginibacter myungsuensis]|uniref:Uncharacterized protein n=1 Tax=Mucilaginibacter myungsuensis TaxID=649104 RepID=A0A929PYC9_9SPHI|nr:hypothetical protein [Mucilaginibacter myungsuensis]MBE9664116.1 hypothetical protein [Mucilaginibacter myungsuensis]MDN3601295.1 hypothetical protein [Mucilaginibacter myungsuensis]
MDPKEQQQEPEDRTPDFVEDPTKISDFGDEQDKEREQESFPELSNQSDTQNETDISDLDIDPTHDGDGSIV